MTQTQTLPHARPRRVGQAALVLGDRPLRPGVARQATARFGEDVWDLTPALLAKHNAALSLNFRSLPGPFRRPAKELFFALLASKPPEGHPDRQPSILTIRSCFSDVKLFLTWATQRGRRSLAALTPDDLAAYQQQLLAERLAPASRHRRRRSVRLFWVWRTALTGDRLTFDPHTLPAWADSGATRQPRRAENRTARIPEPVMGPLLGWALRWVDDFADDVLRAQQEWAGLHAHTQTNRRRRGEPPARGLRAATTALLDRYQADGRPLPGDPDRAGQRRRSLTVNLSHLARELHCHAGALRTPPLLALIREAAEQVGVADRAWLRTPVRATLDGQAWHGPIDYGEVPELVRLLHTACYIVVAYLSGMRDSEVKHLRRGCLTRRLDNTGRVYRRTVTSQAFKGEGTPTGVEATWVVGEPVEHAIGILERLQPPDQNLLFARPSSSRHFTRQHPNQAITSQQTNSDLAGFVDWINRVCDAHGRPDRIPPVKGRPWRLVTSQFRRTLAWFIARRPGGAIAGAIHYRHQRVQMFEGYAGTSASGFRAEVEAEQALERGERLLATVDGHQHQLLGGPGRRGGRAAPGRVRPPRRVRRRGRERPTPAAADHAPPRPQHLPRRVRHLRVQPRQGALPATRRR